MHIFSTKIVLSESIMFLESSTKTCHSDVCTNIFNCEQMIDDKVWILITVANSVIPFP